jgi:hypothetical protein
MESKPAPTQLAPLFVWWFIWFGVLGGLVAMYFFLGRPSTSGRIAQAGLVQFIGLAPLTVSFLLRWLVFPRQTERAKALVIFILGLSSAEGCGIMGLTLGGSMRQEIFLLALLGVLQWAPFGASRFLGNPRDRAHGLRSP